MNQLHRIKTHISITTSSFQNLSQYEINELDVGDVIVIRGENEKRYVLAKKSESEMSFVRADSNCVEEVVFAKPLLVKFNDKEHKINLSASESALSFEHLNAVLEEKGYDIISLYTEKENYEYDEKESGELSICYTSIPNNYFRGFMLDWETYDVDSLPHYNYFFFDLDSDILIRNEVQIITSAENYEEIKKAILEDFEANGIIVSNNYEYQETKESSIGGTNNPQKYQIEDMENIPNEILKKLKVGDVIVHNAEESEAVAFVVDYISDEDVLEMSSASADTVSTYVYGYNGDEWVFDEERGTNLSSLKQHSPANVFENTRFVVSNNKTTLVFPDCVMPLAVYISNWATYYFDYEYGQIIEKNGDITGTIQVQNAVVNAIFNDVIDREDWEDSTLSFAYFNKQVQEINTQNLNGKKLPNLSRDSMEDYIYLFDNDEEERQEVRIEYQKFLNRGLLPRRIVFKCDNDTSLTIVDFPIEAVDDDTLISITSPDGNTLLGFVATTDDGSAIGVECVHTNGQLYGRGVELVAYMTDNY